MPEPTIMTMAAALATRATTAAFGGLCRWVKEQFSPEAQAVLEAAIEAPEDEARVEELGRELERAEQADPEFGQKLREQYERANMTVHADNGSVANQVRDVNDSGKVVQLGTVHGNISL